MTKPRFKEPEGERRAALLRRLRETNSPDVMHELHMELRGGRPVVSYTAHPDGTITIPRASLIEMIETAKENALLRADM